MFKKQHFFVVMLFFSLFVHKKSVFVHICADICSCMWRAEIKFGDLPPLLSTLCLETETLTKGRAHPALIGQ